MGKIKIKRVLFFALGVLVFCTAQAQAQLTGISNLEEWGLPAGDINTLLENILTWTASILGFVALIVLVWAGVRYMTAGGNEERQTQAKKFITYAVLGLAFALASLVIIHFIYGMLEGNESVINGPSL